MIDLSEYEDLPNPFAGAPTFRERMPEPCQVVYVEGSCQPYVFWCTVNDGDPVLSDRIRTRLGRAGVMRSTDRWIPAKRKDGAS